VLQDGREKNEISIIVKNPFGSSDADINSKGESGLLNFIVSETLAEVGMISHRVGYRWLDEIATTQDQQVRRSIFGYVQQRTKDLGILTFVVDHSLEVANYADHVLVAVKDQNGTTYHWEN
jgi:DNA repair exonuclease SbcCD ATPase subunit